MRNVCSFDLPDIDYTFNNDIDIRWFGHFGRANDTGLGPALRTFKLERLRILYLYFKIVHPNIAQLIAQLIMGKTSLGCT